uniref:Uncharacterized protein n=1 Tax=Fagus sylvatica TaxID=28930 RepID=A0A2N9HHP4_FAGSY
MDELPFVDTPLHIAASLGHISFAMEMMRLKPSFARKPNPDGYSPIHLALQNWKTQMVRRLLRHDGDLVRVKGREGMTPLHYVAEYDYLNLLPEFLFKAFKLMVEWLKGKPLLSEVTIPWKDDEGNTVLHVAAVSALLALRNDVGIDVKNLEGNTPWDILKEQTQVDNMEIRDMLLLQRAYYETDYNETGW